ncbi:LCP family protein [Streptomyces hesseae]|uniref:LCP family protein n=1 Tax=Streptomyces hesseae TaxID=3075519 RepID=A0ABU2SRB5_9ACTN|nr:LCP family protein [Streptomyces sp. DSM 40473]MDT0451543.1 LCP family protein [Streptomyces sp. DSM 40473]
MNDRQDPYAHDPYAQAQVYGYDVYGQPVYRPDAPERVYDAYGQPIQQQVYGYDPYTAQPQQPQAAYDSYATQTQQAQQAQQEWIPRQTGPVGDGDPEGAVADGRIPEPRPAADSVPPADSGPGPAPEADAEAEAYRTGQFSFIEEPDEGSEDVIDWLKFSESRTERRDERKRKGRNRVVALAVVLVLALGGGIGWFLLSGGEEKKNTAAATGAQKRDVIVVHLRQTQGGDSSTALLVDNETTKKATTLLLPNSLGLTTKEGGTATTLGKAVQDAGTGATRDALNTLLGADIKGSWRLDTPYLENLVELVGGITVDTDATVPGAKQSDGPLVEQGKGKTLNGRAAVGYATYRATGEDQGRQLARFGQVMQAVLRKLSTDPQAATTTVDSLAQIPDPSLSVQQLGASLAHLAEKAKEGSYATSVLPVKTDGALGGQAADTMVKDVLGGTVRATAKGAPPRVSVKNATGSAAASGTAQVTLVNGGYTYVDGGASGTAEAASSVTYTDDARAAEAKQVARTLGLPEKAVRKGTGAGNADVAVVLGKDYKS